MSLSRKKVPLGAILQQAGLVSAENVKKALEQQNQTNEERRIGEILAAQGHIDPQTADFFADTWFELIQEIKKKPIGQYFRDAKLLNEAQIQSILANQKKTKLRFGEQAVLNGFLKQTTVDFFLRYLAYDSVVKYTAAKPPHTAESKSIQEVKNSFYQIKLKLLNLEDQEDYYKTILDRVLFWTEGQSCLTQKLFDLIVNHKDAVVAGKESEQVDYLIKSKCLSDWRNQLAGEHLQTIENRLLNSQRSKPIDLLRLYQQVLTSRVLLDSSPEQQELINIGLLAKQEDHLVVANRIYRSVFDFNWIEDNLAAINHNNFQAAVVPAKANSVALIRQSKSLPFKNLLLFLALLALMIVLFDSLNKKIKVRAAFKKGNQFLKQKSYAEAIAQYNKLLNIDSNYFQAWTNRGYALAGLEKYEEMRESCSTATIINPTAVYAWNCQGEALHNLQRETQAIDAFDKAISLDQAEPIFLINKSESLKSLGQEAESLATISQAISVLKKIESIEGKDRVRSELAVALTFLGNGYRKQEKYEPAIFNYNSALDYSPNYFPAQLGKGIILNRVKRYSEAQEEFARILENKDLSSAKQAQTWFYLGQTLCQSGQTASSIAAFEKSIELKPDYQAAMVAKQNCE